MEPTPVFDLSPKEAAALIGVHEDTLKRWAAEGAVPAWKTPGGWWKFSGEQLLEWQATQRPDPEAAVGEGRS